MISFNKYKILRTGVKYLRGSETVISQNYLITSVRLKDRDEHRDEHRDEYMKK